MRRLLIGLLLAALPIMGGAGPSEAQDILRVGVPADINNLDPAKANIGEEHLVNYLTFNGLTKINRNLEVIPDLAASWEGNEDQTVFTFHLREGVRFHHGKEVEAKDVVATMERVLDKSIGSPARSQMQVVDRIEALDRYTVRFHLNTSYSDLPALMGERQLRIVPSDRIDKLATEPSGTGPFRLKEYLPGDRIVLEKNRDYFEAGLPKLDGVLFRIMPETAARMAALETGEIDLLWRVPLDKVEVLENNADVEVKQALTWSWDALMMNNEKEPFTDVRVRKAIALALDRDKITDIAVFGYGAPTHTPIPQTHPYFNDRLPIFPPKPNIAEAKKLLAEAGYPDGFEIPLYLPLGRPTRERLGLAVQQFIKPLGIEAKIQRVPWDKFVADIEGKVAFFTDGFFARPTPDTNLWPLFHSTGSWNGFLWHYKSERADGLLEAARAAGSDAERARLYKELQALVIEEMPGVVAFNYASVDAHRKWVKNYETHPMMFLDIKETRLER